jgi:hypothetical protein
VQNWLKSIGQGLGGIGLLVVAISYRAEVRAAGRERTGELMGLLTFVAAEISINEGTLDQMIQEPHRLVASKNLLETSFWDRDGLRIARLLGDYGVFSPIAQYYEAAQRLEEDAKQGARTREDVEGLRGYAVLCRQQGAFVRRRIYGYLTAMFPNEYGK